MWKFVKIQLNGMSPMQAILRRCTSRQNIRLAIYGLGVNHIECAISEQDSRALALPRDVVEQIARETRGNEHVILAYDMGNNCVYMVECTPELNAASAVLICVVSELIGAAMPNHMPQPMMDEEDFDEDEMDAEVPSFVAPTPRRAPEVVRRDARGRFVRKESSDEPWREIPKSADGADTVLNRRFRLGRRD